MVICKIWDADYPWDVRVEKVCKSLQQKHEVHLVCRNTKCRPTYENVDGIHIHRLPFLRRNLGWFNRIIGFPAFFNPLWVFTVWRVVRRYRATVVLARDITLALTALLIGRWMGIPVVLDMAENYPAMIRDLWNKKFRLMNVLLRNPALVKLVEKICIRYADHILVVVEESKQRLIELGVSPDKISVVMNTPTLERFTCSNSEASTTPMRKRKEWLSVIYLGLLEWPRGLETAIRAIHEVRALLPEIKLVIIGSGRDQGYFQALVQELSLTEHVAFMGWLDYREAIDHVASADIGLVPHHATDSWNTTIPNKLFDYMSMGKPVIVSNAIPTERIVMEEKCGLVFREQDPKTLGEAIFKLSDQSVRESQGIRGKEAVVRRYNWTVDEERLLGAIEKAACPRPSVQTKGAESAM
jgi:glycosyltransferase involved in cell wall biosynthesis